MINMIPTKCYKNVFNVSNINICDTICIWIARVNVKLARLPV